MPATRGILGGYEGRILALIRVPAINQSVSARMAFNQFVAASSRCHSGRILSRGPRERKRKRRIPDGASAASCRWASPRRACGQSHIMEYRHRGGESGSHLHSSSFWVVPVPKTKSRLRGKGDPRLSEEANQGIGGPGPGSRRPPRGASGRPGRKINGARRRRIGYKERLPSPASGCALGRSQEFLAKHAKSAKKEKRKNRTRLALPLAIFASLRET